MVALGLVARGFGVVIICVAVVIGWGIGHDGRVTATFDWPGFERALTDELVRAVTSIVTKYPGERFYVAALDRIYRETDGPITLPALGLNSVESLAQDPVQRQADLRWSAADWDHYDDDWLPDGVTYDWQGKLTAEACRGTTRQWEATFRRYLATLVRVCRQARTTLHRNGVTDREFVVLLLDGEYHEALIKRVLTTGEVRRLFPELDERAVELARVAALPQDQRAAYFVSRLVAFDGPITSEDAQSALRDLGPAAFPALIPMLDISNQAWQAAKLLAEIGQPDDGIIRALDTALMQTGGADRAWVAAALSRLGRLSLVLEHADSLPQDVVVRAVTAPYTSFRDHGVAPPRLDYRPLEEFIEGWPESVPAVDDELKPGRSKCTITLDEVDEAIHGLTSRHVIVRRHAVEVLGDRSLGAGVARRVLPLLCHTLRQDPDPAIRRLAILSLLFWQKDSRPFGDVIRAALDDPATEVRETAAYWLRQLDSRAP